MENYASALVGNRTNNIKKVAELVVLMKELTIHKEEYVALAKPMIDLLLTNY